MNTLLVSWTLLCVCVGNGHRCGHVAVTEVAGTCSAKPRFAGDRCGSSALSVVKFDRGVEIKSPCGS